MLKKSWVVTGIFLGLSLFSGGGICLSDSGAYNGDIRIFNPAFTTEHLKLQLFMCKNNQPVCSDNDLIAVTQPSIELKPGIYTTVQAKKLNPKINGKRIFIKLYSIKRNSWSPAIQLIETFNNKEAPFYQFNCWYPEATIPHCSQGLEEEIGGD